MAKIPYNPEELFSTKEKIEVKIYNKGEEDFTGEIYSYYDTEEKCYFIKIKKEFSHMIFRLCSFDEKYLFVKNGRFFKSIKISFYILKDNATNTLEEIFKKNNLKLNNVKNYIKDENFILLGRCCTIKEKDLDKFKKSMEEYLEKLILIGKEKIYRDAVLKESIISIFVELTKKDYLRLTIENNNDSN